MRIYLFSLYIFLLFYKEVSLIFTQKYVAQNEERFYMLKHARLNRYATDESYTPPNTTPKYPKKQYYGKLIKRTNTKKSNLVNCEWLVKPSAIDSQEYHIPFDQTAPIILKADGILKDLEKKETILEFYGFDKSSIHERANSECDISTVFRPDVKIKNYFRKLNALRKSAVVVPQIELMPLHVSGPSQNRMDMIMMGDGYTQEEYDLFVRDMTQMTKKLLNGTTFQSILPILNIWGLFVPSKDSGIGVNGVPKDTAFGLYRDGTELRGIYSSKPFMARYFCRKLGHGMCDFPSIIANDAFYGGLGGEFVISTSSNTSGVMVLRHEMGHNFINIGEEYDDGEVYSGVNSAQTLKQSRAWHHWASRNVTHFREEEVSRAVAEHVWKVLSPSKPTWKKRFSTSGKKSRWFLRMSLSGFKNDDDIQILLDDTPLPWKSQGILDRTFYEWFSHAGFTPGNHIIQVNLLNKALRSNVPTQVCDLSIIEYGNEEQCHFSLPKENKVIQLNGGKTVKIPSDEYISAFPTWDYKGDKTYRPTNEHCIMRNMQSNSFCSVCREGLWLRFLSRIKLIDFVLYVGEKVELNVVRLGQFRTTPILGEYLTIQWLDFNGNEILELRDQLSAADLTPGQRYYAKVTLKSSEIRVSSPVLRSTVKFKIPIGTEHFESEFVFR